MPLDYIGFDQFNLELDELYALEAPERASGVPVQEKVSYPTAYPLEALREPLRGYYEY